MSGERPKTHEPFSLLTKTQDVTRPVTLAMLSEQFGALSQQVVSVESENAKRFKNIHDEMALMRQDYSALSRFVMGDQAPRITAVEGEVKEVTKASIGTRALVVGGKALNVGKWIAIATGVLGIATQIASMFRPDWVQPLQTLSQWVGGLQ